MDYVLTTFDELVYGQLSPQFAENDDTASYIQYLRTNFPDCNLITLGKFTKTKNNFNLIERKELCCLHPEINRFRDDQLPLFREMNLDGIQPDCFSQLEINPEKVIRVKLQTGARKASFGFMQTCRWENISDDNLRYYFYCGLLKIEKESVIRTIQNGVQQMSSRKRVELYIHNCQQSLLSLCMKVINQIGLKKNFNGCVIRDRYSTHDIFSLIYYYLEKILLFIERNYRPFLNRDIWIPFQSRLLEESNVIQKKDIFKSTLVNYELSSELKSIIISPALKLNYLSPTNRITYNELLYIDAFLDQFLLSMDSHSVLSEDQIMDILIRVNFNSPELIRFVTNRYKKMIHGLPDSKQQLDYLYRLLKGINQNNTCSGLSFNQGEPALNVQLSCWIEEEIQYLNMSNRVLRHVNDLFSEPVEYHSKKLPLNLSVPELAVLFRAMYDEGLVLPQNQSEIFEFIASNFSSKKQNDISASSAKQRYYTPDEVSIRSLTDKLKAMIRRLDNY